ncbi:hypothetical protein J1N10_11185 [Carboxylicivirga sp. A043]|uniref:hypothetical protein n=1 Tax=Carboxylicivirga litoralis TaxID=2816963 RepID=UPI0021CB494B|nr:hypothetical protein [Carboxylicivirga sp. A043]MCU4156540.1 hypothetical protein [Carboxylicivirga sp. A043]
MKSIFTALFVFICLSSFGQQLDSLLNNLEMAIEQKEIYEEEKIKRIDKLKNKLYFYQSEDLSIKEYQVCLELL